MEANGFAVGEIAIGEQFIGREKELAALSHIFDATTSIHLVGATRIGKSSLVERVFENNSFRKEVIPVMLDLSIYENAFQFWFSLCEEIADATENLNHDDAIIEKHANALLSMDSTDVNWYAHMRRPLTKTLERLKRLGYRVVVAIDEFDAVTRVFEGNAAYYQMLRSLVSEGKYGLNGVIVSRRNLEVLEAKTRDVSTFHGVFDTLRLKAFNKEELELFYARTEELGFAFNCEAKDQLKFYTGGIPYLCCMLAKQIMSDSISGAVDGDAVISAHKSCQPEIWRYYNDLVTRLKEDGHLEALAYLAFDEMRTLSYAHNRENMMAMGYLIEEEKEDGSFDYFAYSKSFMGYLKTKPLDVPAWNLISASEKKLKEIFASEFPLLAQIGSVDRSGKVSDNDKERLSKAYGDLNFRWGVPDKKCGLTQNEKFLKSSYEYMENPTVLDVLAITYVIGKIDSLWAKRFAKYFNADESWRSKLRFISDIRNPIAHAHGEFISEADMARASMYMQELLALE